MDSKLYFCWELQGSQHLYLRNLRFLCNLRIGIGKITYARQKRFQVGKHRCSVSAVLKIHIHILTLDLWKRIK